MATHPESVSQRVVRAVAEYTDTGPLELPPLYDTIDAVALDALFSDGGEKTIHFQYTGCFVTIRGDGTVTVTDEPEECANQDV